MFKLAWTFLKISALNEMAYRANFFFQAFESTLALATTLGTAAIVYSQTTDLAGWNHAQLISLLGIYYMVLGSINFVISPSLNKFMADIIDGKLDFTLTKPRDSQLLVSISEFRLWKLLDVLLGMGVLGYGLNLQLQDTGTAAALLFTLALLCAGVIVYSFWIMLATLAFWFIRIENITQIFWAMFIAARWPVTIYPTWLRWTLTLLVPVAFAVTVPAEAIAGKLTTETLSFAVLFAMGLAFASRKFWQFGVRFYAGASA
ncbi:MAG: ABC transporter permease [Pseudomonadota bacterium]